MMGYTSEQISQLQSTQEKSREVLETKQEKSLLFVVLSSFHRLRVQCNNTWAATPYCSHCMNANKKRVLERACRSVCIRTSSGLNSIIIHTKRVWIMRTTPLPLNQFKRLQIDHHDNETRLRARLGDGTLSPQTTKGKEHAKHTKPVVYKSRTYLSLDFNDEILSEVFYGCYSNGKTLFVQMPNDDFPC